MKANDFIIWLKGFLTGKEQLSKEEVKALQKELDNVENNLKLLPKDLNLPIQTLIRPWNTENPILLSKPSSGCQYPDNCGMPSIWHGVMPPTCQKCGLRGQSMDITYSTDSTVNYDLNTSHITGDLNESQD